MKKGQTGRKRTNQEHERDLVIVAEMYLRATPQYKITEFLNAREGIGYQLSQMTISNDIAILHERWIKSQVGNMDIVKHEQLKKIDMVEAAAWAAWDRSLQTQSKTKTLAKKKSKADDAAPESPDEIQKEVSEEMGVGDPRFLSQILACVRSRIDLFALKTTKVDVTSGGDKLTGSVIVLPSNGREEFDQVDEHSIEELLRIAAQGQSDS